MNVLSKGIHEIVWPSESSDPKSCFTTKNFYKWFYDGGNCSDFPIYSIWMSEAPMKGLLGWLLKERSLQRMCLKEEILIGLEEEETVSHLLFHCH